MLFGRTLSLIDSMYLLSNIYMLPSLWITTMDLKIRRNGILHDCNEL